MRRHPLSSFFALDLLISQWLVRRTCLDRMMSLIERAPSWIHYLLFREDSPSWSEAGVIPWHLWDELNTRREYLSIGAGPYSSRRHPVELLSSVYELECEDSRDKIYGIRTFVKWPGDRAPTVDYTKENFILAKEVVELLCHEKAPQNFPMPLVAHAISKLLNVTHTQPALKEAINSRQGNTRAAPHSSREALTKRKGDITWGAVRFGEMYKLHHREHYTEIRDRNGMLEAYAPRDVREEDWFVVPRENLGKFFSSLFIGSYDRCDALILRPCPETDRFSIVGRTFTATTRTYLQSKEGKSSFVIWWDAEDLLVNDWRRSQYDWNKDISEQLDLCFGHRFSAVEGASYAMGPYSREELTAMSQEGMEGVILEPAERG